MSDYQAEEQGQEQEGRPEWLLDKFASPEAQAQAYAEAEREMNRLRAETERQQNEFARALEAFEQRPEPQPQYQPGYGQADPLLQAAQRAMDEGDVATFLAINAQLSQAAVTQVLDDRFAKLDEKIGGTTQQVREQTLIAAEQRVSPKFGDRWSSELVPKIQQELARDPSLLPPNPSVEAYEKALEGLAKQIDYDRLTAAHSQLEAERQAKLEANTLAGGQARVTYKAPANEQAWNEIKDADTGSWANLVGDA